MLGKIHYFWQDSFLAQVSPYIILELKKGDWLLNEVVTSISGPSAFPEFTINSLTFLLFSAISILLFRIVRSNKLSTLVLFILNCLFLSFIIATSYELLFLFGILINIYILGWVDDILKSPSGIFKFGATICLWTFLFLFKDPELFSRFNPFVYFPIQILGISYIIFRGISYLFEKDLVEVKGGFFSFFNYIVFFPTMISGPIERFNHFSKQKPKEADLSFEKCTNAFNRILNGLIKKFVLADNLMSFGVFALAQEPNVSPILLWIGSFSMLFLIYLDFSGYCDIMIGIAELMGFKLGENFNRPFLSRNIQEFWTRWHISLGSIIQDYVFTPLNKFIITNFKRDKHFILITATYMLSMILVALWHGTTLGFLIFGTVHGIALVFFQLKKKYHVKFSWALDAFHHVAPVLSPYGARLITYCFVSFSLILWYGSVTYALNTFSRLLGF